ncbi:MAG: cytochrome b/b6 domain-containing protein [Casimicrobiaceae bacterium]
MEKTRILVWDLPVRAFHWLLALSFAGAFLTAESERVRDLHVALGYTFAGLLVFRMVWGLIGSRHARFTSFAYGPRAVWRYVVSLLARRPEHYAGHNPAGAWAIFAMLALGFVIAGTGYATYADIGGEAFEDLHEAAANAMLALVVVHVAAVLASSFVHGENLVAAMITGRKQGAPEDGIRGTRWVPVAALAAAVVGLWVAFFNAPDLSSAEARGPDAARGHPARGHDRGDDS